MGSSGVLEAGSRPARLGVRSSGRLTSAPPATATASRRGQVGEAERDDAADRVVADGHAVQRVGGLDRAAVVGDDDELDVLARASAARTQKRPMFASSSAASTSSSTQNGTGRTSSMASSSATAVSARSPPESIARGWRFLPGGRAVISTPVVERSSGSVSESCASPPPKSCSKRRAKAPSSAAKVAGTARS